MSTRDTRYLKFQLIDAYRRTGQLLTLVPEVFFMTVLARHHIPIAHARVCMALFHEWAGCDWAHYERIDDWWLSEGNNSPRTPFEALNMLRMWRMRLQ
jgi:hypothetical protein